MSKTREKAAAIVNVSESEYHNALTSYATSRAQLKGIEAKIEAATIKIRDKHATEIDKLHKVGDDSFRVVQFYVEQHRAALFAKDRKSVDCGNCVVGFRTATPSLKIAIKGDKWENVLQRLPEAYVRTKVEPAKDLMIAHREELTTSGQLREWGLVVEQAESFYIEVKEENLTN